MVSHSVQLVAVLLAVFSSQSLAQTSNPNPPGMTYPPPNIQEPYPGVLNGNSRRRLSGLTTTTSAFHTHTHIVDNTAGFVYVGCYKDVDTDRDLVVLKSDLQDMTPNQCNTECNGYDYFAIQISRCWCGSSYGKHGVAQAQYSGLKNADNLDYEPGCYHDCPGHSAGYQCGGVLRNSVYRRPSTMEADCQTGEHSERTMYLKAQGVCKPEQGQLTPATMPPGQLRVDTGHSETGYSHPGKFLHKHTINSGAHPQQFQAGTGQPCPGQHNCHATGGDLPDGSAQIWDDEQSHQV